MIDIGANLTDKVFQKDLDSVLARAQSAGIDQIVLTGTDIKNSHRARELATEHPQFLYSTAGIHPHVADTFTEQSIDTLKDLAHHNSVVAVGETGLDFFRNFSPKDAQIRAFEAQLDLAHSMELPVFIHDRESNGLLLEILRNFRDLRGVVHCFTGSTELMKKYLDLDFYIGITGWVCDERRGRSLKYSVRYIPDERLLTETDAPYLLPRNINPLPRSRRNEPCFLPYVLKTLADARNQSLDHVKEITIRNAKHLFALD